MKQKSTNTHTRRVMPHTHKFVCLHVLIDSNCVLDLLPFVVLGEIYICLYVVWVWMSIQQRCAASWCSICAYMSVWECVCLWVFIIFVFVCSSKVLMSVLLLFAGATITPWEPSTIGPLFPLTQPLSLSGQTFIASYCCYRYVCNNVNSLY